MSKFGFELGCMIKANGMISSACGTPPRPVGRVPSVGVLLRDLSMDLHKFWRKPQKTPKAKSTSVNGD